MEREGVIKFKAVHQQGKLSDREYSSVVRPLTAWRRILVDTGMVGQVYDRYQGLGFGNISARVGAPNAERGRRGFLITGTQTGAIERLNLSHYALVSSYGLFENTVESRGEVQPSSEAMTHGAIYDLSPSIRFVFHGHAPSIWHHAKTLNIPITGADIPYGTIQMAREMARLYHETSLPEVQLLSMAGHEDGVIVFGRTAEEAGLIMIRYLARAYELL